MLTAETITTKQIVELLESLPPEHYAVQWCLDAITSSASHPHRRRNARRECANLINARNGKGQK